MPDTEVISVRVCYLDDDQISLAVASSVLTSCGFQVHTTDNPAELLDAPERPFDLIMLELLLPGMDGFAVCHSLRSEGWQGPILIVSAKVLANHERWLLDEYRAGFVTKPFGPHHLVSRVRQALAEAASAPHAS